MRRHSAALIAAVTLLGGGGVARAQSARELREKVGAIMARPAPPTPDEYHRAHMNAEGARRVSPGEPWGAAAHVDIARRWGDPTLLARRVMELRKYGPDHEETKRVLAAVARRSRWPWLIGWSVFFIVAAATVIDVFRVAWRRRVAARVGPEAPPRPSGIVVLVALVSLTAAPARAQGSPFPIDDANPEASVPSDREKNTRPLEFAAYLQDMIDRAMKETKQGNHATAARYYRALAIAVPDVATAFSKLCESLEAAGRRGEAIGACRYALAREGVTVDDHVRFVHLVLGGTDPIGAKDLDEAMAAAAHIREQPGSKAIGHHLECEIGARTQNLPMLERCTAGLALIAPADPKTLTFRWTLAVARRQHAEASRLVDEARAAGLSEEAASRMERATAAILPSWQRPLRDWRFGLGAVLCLGAGVIVVIARVRRKSTPAPA